MTIQMFGNKSLQITRDDYLFRHVSFKNILDDVNFVI